jgi:hypothetical protein
MIIHLVEVFNGKGKVVCRKAFSTSEKAEEFKNQYSYNAYISCRKRGPHAWLKKYSEIFSFTISLDEKIFYKEKMYVPDGGITFPVKKDHSHIFIPYARMSGKQPLKRGMFVYVYNFIPTEENCKMNKNNISEDELIIVEGNNIKELWKDCIKGYYCQICK